MPRCRGRPYIPTCYPSCFFQWWNIVFPHPATEPTNGALRRTNSGYFGYCNSHHLPDQMDLVIIELDTEDELCIPFRFSSVSFIPPVSFFTSVHYRSVAATALRPISCIPHRHLNNGLAHTKQVDAHEAHPTCLLIYPLPWLHLGLIMALPFSHLPFSQLR